MKKKRFLDWHLTRAPQGVSRFAFNTQKWAEPHLGLNVFTLVITFFGRDLYVTLGRRHAIKRVTTSDWDFWGVD